MAVSNGFSKISVSEYLAPDNVQSEKRIKSWRFSEAGKLGVEKKIKNKKKHPKKENKVRDLEKEGQFVRKKRIHEDLAVRRLLLIFARSGGIELCGKIQKILDWGNGGKKDVQKSDAEILSWKQEW